MHVVLVGPDPVARRLLASIVRYCGALVTPVASMAAALEVMARLRADLVIAVMRGAGDEGVDLIADLRGASEEGRVVPVVALTPSSDALKPEPARIAGFAASLTMPVDPWELCRTIEGLRPG
jgi:CheY-like chemotaxis protein